MCRIIGTLIIENKSRLVPDFDAAGCIWTTGKWKRTQPDAFGRQANEAERSRMHLDGRQMEPDAAGCIWTTGKWKRTPPDAFGRQANGSGRRRMRLEDRQMKLTASTSAYPPWRHPPHHLPRYRAGERFSTTTPIAIIFFPASDQYATPCFVWALIPNHFFNDT